MSNLNLVKNGVSLEVAHVLGRRRATVKKKEPPQGVQLRNEMCLQTPVEDGNAEDCMYPGQENVEGRGDGMVPRWDLAGPGVC